MTNIEIKVLLDSTQALAGLNQVKTLTNELNGRTVNVNVASNAAAATQGIRRAMQGAQEAASRAGNGASGAMQSVTRGASQAQNATRQLTVSQRLLGDSIGNVVAKMAVWQVMGNVVAKPIAAFKEALSVMKEVDKQLTNIQKVSDISPAEIKTLGEGAYSTASKYGVGADEYLTATYNFTKAGLGDSAAGLAEISTKLQLVGDTTADVASKMIIAADNAWKMNGSMDALSLMVDKADYINNNYATDIAKLSEGMPVVASVAANANVSMEETLAALGTITASTQETGSKAAYAYRALVMNITGELGEVVDDTGETISVTEESINSMTDALKRYAPQVVETAKATGEVINPMEAIGALSQAYQEGLLSDIELTEILTKVGGKMRTNQLTALVKNFDMYQSMLEGMKGAAGTADDEINTMMDSWERKSQVLSNTWTKFVSDLLNTDAIKGAIDGLTGFINILDSDIGQTVIGLAALEAGIVGISKAGKALAASKIAQTFTALKISSIKDITAAISSFASSLGPLGIAMAAGAGIFATIKVIDALTLSFDEAKEHLTQFEQEYKSMTGAGSEWASLQEKAAKGALDAGEITEEQYARITELRQKLNAGEELTLIEKGELDTIQALIDAANVLTGIDERRLNVLESQIAAQERQIEKAKQEAAEIWQNEVGRRKDTYGEGRGQGVETRYADEENVKKLSAAQKELSESFRNGRISAQEYRDSLLDLITEYQNYYDGMTENVPEDMWSEAQKGFKELYDTIAEFSNLSGDDLAIRTVMEDLVGGFEIVDGGIGKTVINVDALRQSLEKAGVPAKKIQEIIGTFQDSDTQVAIDVQSNAEDSLKDLANLGVAIDEVKRKQVNVDGLAELARGINLTTEQTAELVTKLGTINGIKFVNANGEVVSLQEALITLGNTEVKPKVDIKDDASPKSKKIQDSLRKIASAKPAPRISLTGADIAIAQIRNVQTALNSLKSKTINVAVQTAGGIKGALSNLLGNAEGTRNSPGGLSVVNEEGPEIIVEGGKARIAGDGGPAITSLQKGAMVFTADETKDIFASAGKSIQLGNAFASGKQVSQWELYQQAQKSTASNGSSNTSQSSASTSSSKKTTSSKSTSSSNSSSGAVSSTRLEGLQKELELLRAQYNFLEASGAAVEELMGKSGEIQGKLHEINEELRATGGEEKDILSNSADWWKELDTIHGNMREHFQEERNLLSSQLSLGEKQKRPLEERIDLLRKTQDSLHQEAEYLRSIGEEQEEINALSVEWWEIQRKIEESIQDTYGAQQDLLKSQIELLAKRDSYEGANRSAGERIALYKQIQDSLHQEAEQLRAIGGDQEEINQLSIQWWEIQEDILSVQQDLWDELNDSVEFYQKKAKQARDEEIRALDRENKRLDSELERLNKARQAKQDEEDLEQRLTAIKERQADIAEREADVDERRLELEKARQALLNAQNERTVRSYNAKTGQWEWAANQKDVDAAKDNIKSAEEALQNAKDALQKAKDALQDAKKDLDDYHDDMAYQAAVAAINAQKEAINLRKEAINDAYDQLIAGWEKITESLQKPTREIGEILNDIAQYGTPEMKAQVGNVNNYLGKLAGYIEAAVGSRTGDSYAAGQAQGLNGPTKNYKLDTSVDYSALMLEATTKELFDYWAEQRTAKIKALNLDPVKEGWRTNEQLYQDWLKNQYSMAYQSTNDLLNKADQKAVAVDKEYNATTTAWGKLNSSVTTQGKNTTSALSNLAKEIASKSKEAKGSLTSMNTSFEEQSKSLKESWKKVTSSFQDPVTELDANLQTIASVSTPNMRTSVDTTTEALNSLSDSVEFAAQSLMDASIDMVNGVDAANQQLDVLTWHGTPISDVGGYSSGSGSSSSTAFRNLLPEQQLALRLKNQHESTVSTWMRTGMSKEQAEEKAKNVLYATKYYTDEEKSVLDSWIRESGASSRAYGNIASYVQKYAGNLQYDPITGGYKTTGTSTASSSSNGSSYLSASSIKNTLSSVTSAASSAVSSVKSVATSAASAITSAISASNSGSSSSSSSSSAKITNPRTLTNKKYDSGGILEGMGGIKATEQDEIVLGPDLTKALLTPRKPPLFEERMEELRYLYGASGGSSKGSGVGSASIGSQYNGDIYQLGGVNLTESAARNMSVYDLAQQAKALSIRKNGN